MPKDYKNRLNRKPERKPLPGWLWLVTGLAIGLFVAFLMYLKDRPADSADAVSEKPPAVVVEKPAPRPTPAPAKPRFDFYTILPEMEVVVPEKEISGRLHQGVRQVETPGTYLLQAGSFRKFEQADTLKARLALLGMETSIQTVTINERETWHRVRVGPFQNLSDLNRARAQLKEQRIDAVLLKIRE